LSNINYTDFDVFAESTKSSKTALSQEQLNTLKNNFNMLNIPTIHSSLTQSSRIKLDNLIVDMRDAKSLREINDKYYHKYPIHLDELMEGEDYD
jgi:hypothetical protein